MPRRAIVTLVARQAAGRAFMIQKLIKSFCTNVLVVGLLVADMTLNGSIEAQESLVPEEHFTVENPADLTPKESEAIYQSLVDDLNARYLLSALPELDHYTYWQRVNQHPYLSATHGQRFINNYVNVLGRNYAKAEEFDHMPVGAVLAKDSFTVTSDQHIYAGPLFLMEKMPAGFSSEARDWRYIMVLPDGSLFGDSADDPEGTMTFCVTCHQAAGDENDHLFFVPPEARHDHDQ